MVKYFIIIVSFLLFENYEGAAITTFVQILLFCYHVTLELKAL